MSNLIGSKYFTRFFLATTFLIGISIQAAGEDDLRRGQLHRTEPMAVSIQGDAGDDNRASRGFCNNFLNACLDHQDTSQSIHSLRAESHPATRSRKIYELNVAFLI